MNWLDIILIVVIVIATFVGLRVGLIKAVFSAAGLIGGIAMAGRFYVPLAERLTFISSPAIAKIVAFAAILITVMIVALILAKVLSWIASAVMLGWVNRLGGAVLGLLFGAVFCGVLLAVWAKYIGVAQVIAESTLAAILLDRLPLVLALLPEEFDGIRSFLR